MEREEGRSWLPAAFSLNSMTLLLLIWETGKVLNSWFPTNYFLIFKLFLFHFYRSETATGWLTETWASCSPGSKVLVLSEVNFQPAGGGWGRTPLEIPDLILFCLNLELLKMLT